MMGLLDQLNEVLLQTPRKYWGDKATRLGSLLGDAASTGAQAYGSANSPIAPEHANTLAGLLADFMPVVGDVKSAYDGMNAAREGDYLGAALGGLGALPLVPNLAGMFIGKGAKTWDAVNASRAMEMEQAGMDPRKIWSETGNWKGPDGHWRQEIPDNESFYRGSAAAGGSRSGDLYLNKPLYYAYPGMADYKITEFPGVGGSTDGRMNMTIGQKDASQTAAHEFQHNVQDVEGFARGGGLSDFGQQKDAELARDALSFAREIKKEKAKYPGADSSALQNSIVQEYQRLGMMDWLPSREARDLAAQPYVLYPDRYPGGGVKDLEELVSLYGLDKRTTPYSDMDLYRRLAGEAEARATQARMSMDAAQRRNVFPEDSYDVPLKDLIIR